MSRFLDWTPEQTQRFHDTIDIVGDVENISHSQAVWILEGNRPAPKAHDLDGELLALRQREDEINTRINNEVLSAGQGAEDSDPSKGINS